MTRPLSKPLPRELKLLLLLLLMVALIVAWYLLTNRRAANTLDPQTGVAVAVGPADPSGGTDPSSGTTGPTAGNGPLPVNGSAPDGSGSTPDNGANPPSGTPGTGGTQPGGGAATGVEVQPNRPVEVEVIPPFPALQVGQSPADPAVVSGGINPQASLSKVPRNNPFRPLGLDASAQTDTARTDTAQTDTVQTATVQTATVQTAAGPDAQPDAVFPQGGSDRGDAGPTLSSTSASSDAGPLAVRPVPGSSGGNDSGGLGGLPTVLGSASSSGVKSTPGRVPVGTSGNGASARTASGTNVSGATPGRTVAGSRGDAGVTVIGGTDGAAVSGGRPGNAARDNVVVSAPPPTVTPIVPPIAGVRVPTTSRVPAAAERPGANGASGAGGAVSAGGAAAPGNAAPTTRVPTAGVPQVIDALGGTEGSGGPDSGQLEQLVQSRQLAFNAAVLGPVNTAIFRSQDGYVVVAVGQNLPNSQITVKAVDATSATLALGNDLKTLELDQR